MASILILAACLAAIKENYRAPLYGETVIIKVLPLADRTAEGMAAHARRLVSPENLRRASLDPRLAGLQQPLRAGDPDEPIGSSPGPQVCAFVSSVEDGTLSVDSVAEGSAAEARSIALAVADAYIADQGANRIVPGAAFIPTSSEFHTMPLGEPWETETAVALAVLASALVLVVPTTWVTKRRLAATLVLVPIASVLLLALREPFPGNILVDVVVGAMVSGAFGVGAMRRPWGFLAVVLFSLGVGPRDVPRFQRGDPVRSGLWPGPDGWCSGRMGYSNPDQGEGTFARMSPVVWGEYKPGLLYRALRRLVTAVVDDSSMVKLTAIRSS
jgi:hypothetical protein